MRRVLAVRVAGSGSRRVRTSFAGSGHTVASHCGRGSVSRRARCTREAGCDDFRPEPADDGGMTE